MSKLGRAQGAGAWEPKQKAAKKARAAARAAAAARAPKLRDGGEAGGPSSPSDDEEDDEEDEDASETAGGDCLVGQAQVLQPQRACISAIHIVPCKDSRECVLCQYYWRSHAFGPPCS